MGKATDSQKARKAILEGVIDTKEKAECAISLRTGKEQLLLDVSRQDVLDAIEGVPEGLYVTFRTFRWGGTRSATIMPFTVSYLTSEIVEVVEITDDMWTDYLSNQGARAATPGGIQVPQPMPPGRFN